MLIKKIIKFYLYFLKFNEERTEFSTCVDAYAHFELGVRLVLDTEGVHSVKNREGHQRDLSSVVIAIPLW